MSLIESTPDPFGGVIINPQSLTSDQGEFERQLRESLAAWKEQGFKVVWLEVPISRAALVPVAVKAGFSFHHAKDENLMLTACLKDGAYIPPYASHYIGVGGVVLNDKRELLVVSERYRRGRGPAYKLPGGALLPGEHVVDAAIREVMEETGVRTQFEYLVCFRHWHGYRYEKSDIYFVCRLSPLSADIQMQVEEIEACLWMPVDEYLGADEVSAFNKRIVGAALKGQGIRPCLIDGYGDPRRYEFFMPEETV